MTPACIAAQVKWCPHLVPSVAVMVSDMVMRPILIYLSWLILSVKMCLVHA